MRKGIVVFFLIMLILFVSGGWSILCSSANDYSNIEKEQLIRFHVIANSDSPNDQQVKLKVRDAVLQYLSHYFQQCETPAQARKVVCEHHVVIKNIAQSVLLNNGFDYPVSVELGWFNFPLKSYGNLVLPGGRYEAVQIKLGKAQGKNWWCVLFPPLCIIDAGYAIPEESVNKVEFKLKSIEMIKKYFTNDQQNCANMNL